MDTHRVISALCKHTPLPAEGTYDAITYAAIGEVLGQLPNCDPDEAIPALLGCVDVDSDLLLLADAAIVLASFPADRLERHLRTLSSMELPTAWLLAILYQLPQFASREHLERLREEEVDYELRDRIDEELSELSSTDHGDELDSQMEQFKRQQKLPQACEQADQAMRRQSFSEVVRILSPYRHMLPPIYQKKLDLAQRKIASNRR